MFESCVSVEEGELTRNDISDSEIIEMEPLIREKDDETK